MASGVGWGEESAQKMDLEDPLYFLRSRFYLPPDTVYMDGNSLGLLTREGEASVLRVVDEWKTSAIGGWMTGDDPWWTLGERLGARVAPIIGADPSEVVVTGTTTVNIHSLVSALYRPQGDRRQILATCLDFPSDIYALSGQLAMRHGPGSDDLLVLAPSRDGHNVEEEDIVALMTDDVALALMPSVLYRSGQLLDIERLTARAHERGIVIGFDCSHSIGAVPHRLSAWGVDFAMWCHYKYMNAGPGAAGGLYVNARRWGATPVLSGWWGFEKERQFDMVYGFSAQPGPGGFQISSPAVLSTVPLEGALSVFEEVGIERVRERSLRLTSYLMSLIDRIPPQAGLRIVTPRQPRRRGGHVAVSQSRAPEVVRRLARLGVVVDFRQPDIIRIAPSPLYSSYRDVWQAVAALREVVCSTN